MAKLNINFTRYTIFFTFVSLTLVILSIYSIFFGQGFRYGTDFRGGLEMTITLSEEKSSVELQAIFLENGISVDIQPVVSEYPRYFIRSSLEQLKELGLGKISNENEVVIRNYAEKLLRDIIAKNLSDKAVIDQVQSIGGAISEENKKNARAIVFWVLISIIIYISIRFKYQYGIAAVLAVAHDVVIMLGVLSFFNREINTYTITAVMTIFGYSVNDTIILFDRIRENIKENKHLPFERLINMSINSVFVRSLITSLTTLTVITALFIFSQGAIHDFSLALIVGLISGTYSSIYVASAFILFWNKIKPLM